MPHTLPAVDAVLAAVADRFGPLETSVFRGQTSLVVPEPQSFEVLESLKGRGFDLLVGQLRRLPGVPRGPAPLRALYLLASTVTNQRLTVRVFLDDPAAADEPGPAVRSVVSLWRAADWLEREVWDLFGIRFTGHPDLRRLVMPDEFTAHPLRKDYPLQGRGERHNFPVITRDHS